MCLAVPMRLKTKAGAKGTVELGGVEREVSLQFTPDANLGDYVIVHAGFALEIVNEQDAQETIALLNQMLGPKQEA